jgi:hypothetical protein
LQNIVKIQKFGIKLFQMEVLSAKVTKYSSKKALKAFGKDLVPAH